MATREIREPQRLATLLDSVSWSRLVPVEDAEHPLYDLAREIEAFESSLAGALSRPEAPLMSESVAKAIRSAAEDFEAALYALPSEAQESPLAKQIREHYNRLCSFM